MPRGVVRDDPNQGGPSFRNGQPVTLPINYGTEVTLPKDFGNEIPAQEDNSNEVTWQTPDPTHFGNEIS
jgi:hypothetical protein